jgi:Putative nucleotidyltransferase DUF294
LSNGRTIASARTTIYTGLVGDWAEEQQRVFGYDKPFAVIALGGTGRAERSPCSDNDFAFLFDDALEEDRVRPNIGCAPCLSSPVPTVPNGNPSTRTPRAGLIRGSCMPRH